MCLNGNLRCLILLLMGFFRSLFSAVDGIIEISVSDVTTGLQIEWINQPDIDDYTPLQKAVIHHLTSKVQYLLQKGADPRAKNMLNESARSINKRLCHYYLTCLQKNYQNYQSSGDRLTYRDTRRHFKDLYSSQLAINKSLNKK